MNKMFIQNEMLVCLRLINSRLNKAAIKLSEEKKTGFMTKLFKCCDLMRIYAHSVRHIDHHAIALHSRIEMFRRRLNTSSKPIEMKYGITVAVYLCIFFF